MASMADVRRIVWSIYWKTAIASIVLAMVLGGIWGFTIGFAGGFFGGMSRTLANVIYYGGMLLGFVASFLSLNFFVARTIGKPIDGKTLTLNKVGHGGE